AHASRATASPVVAHAVETVASGEPRLRRGGSRDRRSSVQDAQMRHGRKSRHGRIDGYTRHVLQELESGLAHAVGVTAANAAAASVTTDLDADLAAQQISLADLNDLHLDRAYLSSRWGRERPPTLTIRCKAWPVHKGDRFPKTACTLEWQQQRLECPHHVTAPFQLGGTVHFPAAGCAVCPVQGRCPPSLPRGSVHIPPRAPLLAQARAPPA